MIEHRKAEVTLDGIEAIIGSPKVNSQTSFEEAVELHIMAPEGSLWHLEGKIADEDESPFAELVRILKGPRLRGPFRSDLSDEDRLCLFTGITQDPHSLLAWLATQGVEVRITKIPWVSTVDSYKAWQHYEGLTDADTVYEGQPPLLSQEGFWSRYWFLTLIILAFLLVALVFFTES